MCLPLWGQHNIIQLNIVILLCSGNIVILFCSINVVILLCSGNTFVSMSPSFTNFKVLDPVNDWVRVLTWYVTHRLRRQTLANRLVRNICKKQVQFDFKCFLGNGNGHSESDADTAMYICTCQYRSCQYRTWQYRSGQYRTCQYKRGNIGVYCTILENIGSGNLPICLFGNPEVLPILQDYYTPLWKQIFLKFSQFFYFFYLIPPPLASRGVIILQNWQNLRIAKKANWQITGPNIFQYRTIYPNISDLIKII